MRKYLLAATTILSISACATQTVEAPVSYTPSVAPSLAGVAMRSKDGADTAAYVPSDDCYGKNAHSSRSLIGNLTGGTRYTCGPNVAAPVSQTTSVGSTPVRTTTTATRPTGSYSELRGGTTRSSTYTTTATPQRTYQSTTSRTYTQPATRSQTYQTAPKRTYSQPTTQTRSMSTTTNPTMTAPSTTRTYSTTTAPTMRTYSTETTTHQGTRYSYPENTSPVTTKTVPSYTESQTGAVGTDTIYSFGKPVIEGIGN